MENNPCVIRWENLPRTMLAEFSKTYLHKYYSIDGYNSSDVEKSAVEYFRDTLGFNIKMGRDAKNLSIVEFESEKDKMFFLLKYS